MLGLKFIFAYMICIGIHFGVGIKLCGRDCVLLHQCVPAMDLLLKSPTPNARSQIEKAHCGFTYVGQNRVAKVCCSDLASRSAKVIDPIHPNAGLLPTSCGPIYGNRIIGGSAAQLYEYPWMVLIFDKRGDEIRSSCGGSIINNRHVLTAAHCVRGRTIPYVRIGEYDVRYPTDCQGEGSLSICESNLQDIGVEKKIVHPKYSSLYRIENDIALLRLEGPIDLTQKNAKPICLPVSQKLREPLQNGERSEVAGWGVTGNRYDDASILQKVNISVSTRESCVETYRNLPEIYIRVAEKEFCAGEPNKDSCRGDSGGPLMMERTNNNVPSIVQYGIVSRGANECGSSYPGIYTDVTKYMDWILDNISN